MKEVKFTPEQDEQMINDAYQGVLRAYLASNHRKNVEIIEKAFRFARDAHKGIRRRSGEPYILHPIAVAQIVISEIGLGSTSICAAFLHDVVEDTDYTVEDIATQFGSKIAQIVEGLTKISGGKFGEHASVQAENFRRLFLTMSSDIRVVLVKMADRLHNMRTLGSMLPSKQYKIAGETLYIYAPLAHRLGLFAIKTELEDLSFKYEHPETYESISRQVIESQDDRNALFEAFSAPIKERLDLMGLKYNMSVRVKSNYSIWKKMETKNIAFKDVYDLYAARIVFDCDDDTEAKKICWSIYTEITSIFRLHPERTRDWLSRTKPNGYQALHLTVMGPSGKWVEVQIRSRKMDEIAERGFAAHWKYKATESEEEDDLATWMKTIVDILKNPEPNAIDFLDTIKLNLFASEIGVFTPKGELVSLPNGATVLDFAFHLHSEIGTHCIAGKVNHKLVPVSHVLESGDQVEVLTSNSQQPTPEWLSFAKTATAKKALAQALRRDNRRLADAGMHKFHAFLEENNVNYSQEILLKVVGAAGVDSAEQFFTEIATGDIELTKDLLDSVKDSKFLSKDTFKRFMRKVRLVREKKKAEHVTSIDDSIFDDKGGVNQKKVYVLHTHLNHSNYVIAPCCNPIPGDDVMGYVNDDRQVEVHKLTCPKAMKLKASYGGRVVQTKWEEGSARFTATIEVHGIDRIGILQEIVYIISTTLAINMRNLSIGAREGVFECTLIVMVEDVSVVNNLCRQLREVQGVLRATRKQ